VKQTRWTRTTAISVVVSLLLVQVVLAIVLPASRVFATTAPVAITAVVSIIAYIGIPPSDRSEARRETEEAIDQYVLLQDATENQRNIVISRMRLAAPRARYSAKEISDFLQDRANEASRYAGLANVQWQWPNGWAATGNPVQKITPSCKEEQRSTEYFPQLLDLLCNPARKFEHYHTIVAMWGMSSYLRPEQMRQLHERVCHELNCRPTWQSDHWSSFVRHVKDTYARSSGEQDHRP
jgi:hypothetical protein